MFKTMIDAGIIIRVLALTDIDHEPYATISAGEWGTVVRWSDHSYTVQWDKFHKGLARWDNRIRVTDECLDTIARLKLYPIERADTNIDKQAAVCA